MDSYSQNEPATSESETPRYREYLALFLRNKWLILLIALGTMFFAGIYTLQKPRVYEGTAMVLINVKAGQEANPFQRTYDDATSKLANEISILKTRSLARKVATRLLSNPLLDSTSSTPASIVLRDPDEDSSKQYVAPEVVVARLLGTMSFLPEKESDIIRISAVSPDRREAALLANTYADAYKELALQQSRSQTRSLREFLEGRLAEQRTNLQAAEGQVKSYMESTGMVSLDGESNKVVEELSQLEATRNSLSIEIESLNEKFTSIQMELPQQESSVVSSIGQASDPYIRLLGEQLAQLEVQRDVIIAQNDPVVLSQGANQAKLKQIDDQLSNLRTKLRERTNEFIRGYVAGDAGATADNPLGYLQGLKQEMLETRFQLESLRSRRLALDRIITQYEGKFRQIPRQSLDMARLQRERLSNEKLYGLVEEKYNVAAISEKSEYGYVEIIDRESPDTVRGTTNLIRDMILGLIVGLGLAVGIVVLRDALDTRVRTPEQLRQHGFSTLTEIGVFDAELKAFKGNGALPPEALKFDPRIRLIYNPLSYTAESYRRLRTCIVNMGGSKPLKILLFTSSNPGEGKTTTLLNLALSLAETEQRTLVVDCDLRRPTVHSLLGLSAAPGLTDVAEHMGTLDEVLHRNVAPDLDVLTCGTAIHNPSLFFGNISATLPIHQLREKYSWILLDAPPILVVNDAAVLASVSDASVLVVNAGETRFDALKRAASILQSSAVGPMGVVLTRFDSKTAYGAYYGGYKYGHYDSRNQYYRSTRSRKAKA